MAGMDQVAVYPGWDLKFEPQRVSRISWPWRSYCLLFLAVESEDEFVPKFSRNKILQARSDSLAPVTGEPSDFAPLVWERPIYFLFSSRFTSWFSLVLAHC